MDHTKSGKLPEKHWFTKTLAILGTTLVWLPVLAPFVFAIPPLISRHFLRFDYLMPAELFPAALAGGVLVIWAALRAHSRLRLVGWGSVIAIGSLIGGQLLAVLTGLASGAEEPIGWRWNLVLFSLAVYSASLIGIGVCGILLLRDLFKSDKSPPVKA